MTCQKETTGLYLQKGLSDTQGIKLANQIADWDNVTSTRYVSPQEAKDSFKSMDGFAEIIDNLPENPLPGVVIVIISEQSLSVNDAELLRERAAALQIYFHFSASVLAKGKIIGVCNDVASNKNWNAPHLIRHNWAVIVLCLNDKII